MAGHPLATAVSLHVSIAAQTLQLRDPSGATVREFRVSTAAAGTGSAKGSMQTPLGRFRVCAKFGRNAGAWTIFRGRKSVRKRATPGAEGDLITSRILWLDGVDDANANTRERYIYIHGTNHECDLGRPVSHGCVRMANADIIDLFPLVPRGTQVSIA